MKTQEITECVKELNAIKSLLSAYHLMDVKFDSNNAEGQEQEHTFVLWTDNRGNIHDDPVIGIHFDGEELTLSVDNRDDNSIITLYEDDYELNINWLQGIYGDIKSHIAAHPDIRTREVIKSEKARKYLKNAPHFTEQGGYHQNTLIQAVALAEYELSGKANESIVTLIDEIVELKERLNDGYCQTPPVNPEDCDGIDCGMCKKQYYDTMKKELLKQHVIGGEV